MEGLKRGNRGETKNGLSRRLIGLGAGTAAVPIAVLLLIAPAALGSGVVVMTAPYKGVTVGPSSSWSTGGCGHATVAVSPFFHASTGRGGFSDRASAPGCTNPAGSSGSSSGSFTASVPIHLSHAKDTVVAAVQVRAWVSAQMTLSKCTVANKSSYGYCYQSAYADIYGYVYLTDVTTGSYWYATNWWSGLYRSSYNDYYCYNGTCSTYNYTASGPSQVSSSFAWWINATSVNTADTFALVVLYSGYVGAYTSSYGAKMGPGSTAAVANVATNGDGVDLASITIS